MAPPSASVAARATDLILLLLTLKPTMLQMLRMYRVSPGLMMATVGLVRVAKPPATAVCTVGMCISIWPSSYSVHTPEG